MTLEQGSNIRPVELVFIFFLTIEALLLPAGKIQMEHNLVQGSDFLIMPGSCCYNCCVLIFNLAGLHKLVNLN